MKTIVTGISYQDWFFLSQLLLSKGYEVHDAFRRNSLMSGGTMELQSPEIKKQIIIYYGDITDENLLSKLLQYDIPDDFVMGTGEAHTVRDFVDEAFSVVGMNVNGKGLVSMKSVFPTKRKF